MTSLEKLASLSTNVPEQLRLRSIPRKGGLFQSRLHILLNFNWAPLYNILLLKAQHEHWVDNASDDHVWKLLLAYIQYIALRIHQNLFTTDDPPSPGLAIDDVWHTHMLIPQNYADMCRSLGFDTLMSHQPANTYLLSAEQKNKRRGKTAESIGRLFSLVDDMHIGAGVTSNESSKADGQITLTFKTLTGRTHMIAILPTATVLDLKKAYKKRTRVPIDQQRQIYAGEQLEDDRKLASYGIRDGSMIHIVLRLGGC